MVNRKKNNMVNISANVSVIRQSLSAINLSNSIKRKERKRKKKIQL